MAYDIRLEVVTPEKLVVNEMVKIVVAPGVLGEFGVLSGHTPFLTTLKTGALHYTDEKWQNRFVFVNGGFAEALPDRVTVLAESAERRRDIDVKRAKAAVDRAKKRLSVDDFEKQNIDVDRASIALFRALQRIQLAEKL